MKCSRIDTDEILDKCAECGASNPRFIYDIKHHPCSWMVNCIECANCTGWVLSESLAMIEWNRQNRAIEKENNKGEAVFNDRY